MIVKFGQTKLEHGEMLDRTKINMIRLIIWRVFGLNHEWQTKIQRLRELLVYEPVILVIRKRKVKRPVHEEHKDKAD